MNRSRFLMLAALIAVAVGGVALVAPDLMLSSKGIEGNAAARVWMQELRAALLAAGATLWLVRNHDDSPTLQALLWGNAVLQLGLVPIEPIALAREVIPNTAGVVPNTVVHVVLAIGFIAYARAIRTRARALQPIDKESHGNLSITSRHH